jgi:hypothetical protein
MIRGLDNSPDIPYTQVYPFYKSNTQHIMLVILWVAPEQAL